MSQHISAVGLVATDPKLFTSEGGVEFCTFRLACTERRFDSQKQEWIDGETNWFTVNTFRTLAVHASESFAKGDRVVVSGRLRVRNWEKDEKKGTSVKIDADGLGHDVRWGVSTFTKRSGFVDSGLVGSGLGAPQAEASTESNLAAPDDEPSSGAASSGGEFLEDNFTPNVGAA